MSGGGAEARIRRFSAGTWLVGAAVAVVVAFVTMPVLALDPVTGDVLFTDRGQYEYTPWESPEAGELEIVDGEIIGLARGGYIDLPTDPELWMIGPLSGTDEGLGVYQQLDAAASTEDDRPRYLGLLNPRRSVAVLPTTTVGRVWFGPSVRDWRATVERTSGTPVETPMTGEGPALLVYEGEALSGRFTYSGDGFFQADVILPGEVLDLVRGIDEVDERASWPAVGLVVIRIEADEGTWSLTLDEPASAPAPIPSTPSTP